MLLLKILIKGKKMSQFTRGFNVVRIDNEEFGMGLIKIDRNCDVLDKVAKRTMDGDLYREILGVYFNYTLTFGTFWDMDQYDRLYKKLTAKQEFHIISIPSNKGYMTFKGYISKVTDHIEYVNGSNRRITGLTCSFVSKKPYY